MKKPISKLTAGLLALVMIAGGVPADSGAFELFAAKPVVASAEVHTEPYVEEVGNDVILHLAGTVPAQDQLRSIITNSGYTVANITKIVSEEGAVLPVDCSSLFREYTGVTSIDLSNAYTSGVTNMNRMFNCCTSLTDITFGDNFDTSSVTDMSDMFCGCGFLASLDLKNFDTSNTAVVTRMFSLCPRLSEITLSKKFSTGITPIMDLDNGEDGWYVGTTKVSGEKGSAVISAESFNETGTTKITKGIPAFAGNSLTLKDDLGLNFIVKNVTADNMNDYKVVLTGECEENGQELSLTEKTIDGVKYYCVTANVPAKNMDDKITAKLYKSGSDDPISVREYSVNAYLEYLMDNSSDVGVKILARDTLQYGKAARYYFLDGNKPNVPILNFAYRLYEPSIHDAGISLVLKSRLAVRLYIPDLREGAKTDDEELTAVKGADGRYCFEITGITPTGLGTEYTIAYKGEIYKFSPLSWCYRVKKKENAASKSVTIADALYYYYLAAAIYAGSSGNNVIDLSVINGTYEAKDGDILTGTLAKDCQISIAEDAKVTLWDADITNLSDNADCAGITCIGNAEITLVGENKVKGAENNPAIYVPCESQLTIDGSGSLRADGGACGAGIGAGKLRSCGSITINGGDIIAKGGDGAAGIGGAELGAAEEITVNDGYIEAVGGADAAGIGGGHSAETGGISITGGTVIAEGGKAGAGIGSGAEAAGGAVNVTGGDITATAGEDAAGIGSGAEGAVTGVIISGGTVVAEGKKGGAAIGAGRAGECEAVIIENTVESVTATKGENAPYSIGAGESCTVPVSVTIGGIEALVAERRFTYVPKPDIQG